MSFYYGSMNPGFTWYDRSESVYGNMIISGELWLWSYKSMAATKRTPADKRVAALSVGLAPSVAGADGPGLD